jgi:mannose/cellobiose epimerase-like protein (N-acyl-D-glucosamine 2-epimerase family)
MNGVEQGRWAQDWLFGSALPLWLDRGADHRHGGWFDKLDQDSNPLPGAKRLRVQARQAFVFAEAGRLGWQGDWERGVRQGIDFILAHYRRDDGFFRASVDAGGAPVSEAVDIYDQAFTIFALAAGYSALGRPDVLRAEAEGLIANLGRHLAHPVIGFEEARPRILPLRSNPHMHMLEAMLAWIDAGVRGEFDRVARAIVDLATTRLIDPETGAVGEFYDGDWAFAADQGHVREPGHQFEWAYLLDACTARLGGDHAATVQRLAGFGNRHGVVDGRAIFATDAAGRVIDGRARLWAQTERLRTMTILGKGTGPAIGESLDALRRFMAVPVPGLWSDWIDAEGVLVIEPVPASSLYHIVTGLVPLIELAQAAATADLSVPAAS